MSQQPTETISITRIESGKGVDTADKVTVEEPLEVQFVFQTENGSMRKTIAVTMRTPGNDAELAAGFLFTEGIIRDVNNIQEIKEQSSFNKTTIVLKEGFIPDLSNADRNFYTTSSCGVCGKSSMDAIKTVSSFRDIRDQLRIRPEILYGLQDTLKRSQQIFEDTGGIHASAFFDVSGTLLLMREDVGRHNALDKLIGASMLANMLPLDNGVLLLSGRASFELIQKSVMAGIRIIAAVGAPSSLAVELAKENNITLIGFLRTDRFNIYCGQERIVV